MEFFPLGGNIETRRLSCQAGACNFLVKNRSPICPELEAGRGAPWGSLRDRVRAGSAFVGGLTPSPGQGLQGFVDFTALGFYALSLFPVIQL